MNMPHLSNNRAIKLDKSNSPKRSTRRVFESMFLLNVHSDVLEIIQKLKEKDLYFRKWYTFFNCFGQCLKAVGYLKVLFKKAMII